MELNNTVIFGDSYSTFKGHIPEGYAVYYGKSAKEFGVTSVENTWWHMLFAENKANLIRNDSWSGSTVCYTGYDGDCSETSSFICRLEKLIAEGFFEKNRIDTVLIFGATNDSWAGAPVGELQFSDWKKEDLFSVLPAVCCFINRAKEAAPNAKITWIINNGLNEAITQGIKDACKYYGIGCIKIKGIEKISGHPTRIGMIQIKNQITQGLKGEKITADPVKEEFTFGITGEEFDRVNKFQVSNIYKRFAFIFIVVAILVAISFFGGGDLFSCILIASVLLICLIVKFIKIKKQIKVLRNVKERVINSNYICKVYNGIMHITANRNDERKEHYIRFDEIKFKKDMGDLYLIADTKNLFILKKDLLSEDSVIKTLFKK